MINIRMIALFSILAVAIAAFLTLPEEKEEKERTLFADLTLEEANNIDYIKLSSLTDSIILRRDEQQVWHVTGTNDYPAQSARVRQIIQAIIEIKKIEKKTSQAKYYQRLGVEGLEVEGSKSKVIELRSPERTWELIIGNISQHMSTGQYVRRADSTASWLINQRFKFELSNEEWIDTDILHIERDNLKQMTFEYQSRTIEFSREEEGKDMKIKNENTMSDYDNIYRPNRLMSAVDYMKFKHLMPKDTKLIDKNKTVVAIYETFKGMIIMLNIYQQDDLNFFTVDTKFNEQSNNDTQLEVERIKKLTKNRIYEMLDSQKTAIITSLKDINASLKN